MTGTRFVQIEQHWNDSYIYTAKTYMPEKNNTKKKCLHRQEEDFPQKNKKNNKNDIYLS